MMVKYNKKKVRYYFERHPIRSHFHNYKHIKPLHRKISVFVCCIIFLTLSHSLSWGFSPVLYLILCYAVL